MLFAGGVGRAGGGATVDEGHQPEEEHAIDVLDKGVSRLARLGGGVPDRSLPGGALRLGEGLQPHLEGALEEGVAEVARLASQLLGALAQLRLVRHAAAAEGVVVAVVAVVRDEVKVTQLEQRREQPPHLVGGRG